MHILVKLVEERATTPQELNMNNPTVTDGRNNRVKQTNSEGVNMNNPRCNRGKKNITVYNPEGVEHT